jgi:uncharacterized protein
MTREEAYTLLTKYIHNKNLMKHSLATEVTMKALYTHLTPKDKQNDEGQLTWGITGLLHDVDYEEAQKAGDVEQHGTLSFIKEKDELPEDIKHGIQAHAFMYSKVMPESQMDWAITACDQLTGLIIACALVSPDKKLESVTPERVLKKFKQKAFAAGADREMIAQCDEKLGIPFDEFVSITLKAMQSIHEDFEL